MTLLTVDRGTRKDDVEDDDDDSGAFIWLDLASPPSFREGPLTDSVDA